MFEDRTLILEIVREHLIAVGSVEQLETIATLNDSTTSLVLRLRALMSGRSRSLIVKKIRIDAHGCFAREASVLERLASRRVAPLLVCQVPSERILVLEDLGNTSDEETLGVALGRLHKLGPDIRLEASLHRSNIPPLSELLQCATAEAAAIGVRPAIGFESDVRAVLERLDTESAHTLIHGDVHPHNSRRSDEQSFLIDLGDAGNGHPGIDTSCLVLGFPTAQDYRGPLSSGTLNSMLDAYRTARGIDHDAFESELSIGCGYWLLRILAGRFLSPTRLRSNRSLSQRFATQLDYVLRGAASRLPQFQALQSTSIAVAEAVASIEHDGSDDLGTVLPGR